MYELFRQSVFILVMLLSYVVFGWQGAVLVVAVGMGFFFEQFIVTVAFLTGVAIHSVGVAYTYLFFPSEITLILKQTSIMMGGLPIILFPVFSIFLPAGVYALAAFFSFHLAHFIRTYKP